jgi:hypothetical protein
VKVCEEEDMSHFYQFNDADGEYVATLMRKRALMCVDSDETVMVRGNTDIDSVFLNIDLFVCNPEERECAHNSLQEV